MVKGKRENLTPSRGCSLSLMCVTVPGSCPLPKNGWELFWSLFTVPKVPLCTAFHMGWDRLFPCLAWSTGLGPGCLWGGHSCPESSPLPGARAGSAHSQMSFSASSSPFLVGVGWRKLNGQLSCSTLHVCSLSPEHTGYPCAPERVRGRRGVGRAQEKRDILVS